jgi:hypothetical protein
MGCDIHLFVEKKVRGRWVTAENWVPESEEGSPTSNFHVPYEQSFYHGRNYNLFAILADVRNGVEFAGCDTGNGFVPISAPKGLPNDCCREIRDEANKWGGDGHSHSWVTLSELLSYDWTRTTKERAFVSGPYFFRWTNRDLLDRNEGPDEYCGGVAGPGVKLISEDQMKEEIKKLTENITTASGNMNIWDRKEKAVKDGLSNTYCRVDWELPYFTACREFWCNTVPRLLHLGKPEDVRIVFWFDN